MVTAVKSCSNCSNVSVVFKENSITYYWQVLRYLSQIEEDIYGMFNYLHVRSTAVAATYQLEQDVLGPFLRHPLTAARRQTRGDVWGQKITITIKVHE